MNANENSKLPSPETDIRTDLWPTMTVPQLNQQRDLLLDKISKLYSTSEFGAFGQASGNQTVQTLITILNKALTDLTVFIDNKTTQNLVRVTDDKGQTVHRQGHQGSK